METLEIMNEWLNRQEVAAAKERRNLKRRALIELYTRAELEAAEKAWAKGEGQ